METIIKQSSLTRPSDTTAYADKDVITSATAITAATNASPIVITATAHGLVTGSKVTILAVGGNTAANANWTVTKIDADTFSLDGSTGNSAYTSGGTIQKMLRFVGVGRNHTIGTGTIRSVVLTKTGTSATNSSYRLLLFNTQVTLPADNAALAGLVATYADAFQGYVDLVAVAESDGAIIESAATTLKYKCAAGDQNLYGVLVAKAAYTPASAEVFTVKLGVDKDT